MSLSNDLISKFVKITNDDKESTKETTVFGEVTKIQNGKPVEVKIDGASDSTPVSSTVNAAVGNRVVVTIKNHNAIITGNLGSPSVIQRDTDAISDKADSANSMATDAINKVSEFDTVLADKVSTDEFYAAVGRIEKLEADSADIGEVNADIVKIKQKLTANEGEFFDLTGEYVTVEEQLNANSADIEELKTDRITASEADIKYAKVGDLDAEYADFKQATIDDLAAAKGDIEDLQTDRITASQADIKFANIDFSNIGEAAIKKILADSGLIENIVVGDGTITGKLVGVTISGDLIEGNTVVAEKLVIKGTDGLYYKLNTDGMTTEAEQTDYNSLNGSVIKAKSITATKISVDDLVAFDATIGGFNITESSLYSGVKSSADNTTRGIYLDKEGQMAIGDSNNFIKYYKDSDGNYRLVISASSIVFATSNKSVETVINEAVETLTVSGRNLIVRRDELINTYVVADGTVVDADDGYKSATMLNPIRIEAGQTYTFSKNESASDLFFRWAWYDENMNVLGRTAANAVPTTWIAPENAAYVRVSYPYTEGANPKLEKGSEATAYSPAIEDLSDAINNAVETSANDLRTEMDDMEIGGRNLIKNSDFRHGVDKWVYHGITVSVESDSEYGTCLKMVSTDVGSSTQRIYPSTTENFIHDGGTYALSFYAKADTPTSIQTNVAGSSGVDVNHQLTTQWQRFTKVYDAHAGSLTFWPNEADTTIYLTRVKMERGDKPTDWTPAVEDMATSEDVEKAQSSADTAQEKADEAKALIAQLADSISMLVTDGEGTSLMTQTEDGWTFSTAEIQTAVNTASEGLADLTKELGDTNSVVNVLQQAVDDLGVIAEYVKIGTYEDEPCIELGEGDSEFKLRITNTRMMFTEGSSVLAYFNNKSLHIKKAVVEEELQQGGFIWKARANGNLGLVWKGGNS